MRFQEISEGCWSGYQQQGMKKKGDRMVPNCVPVKEVKQGPEMTLNDLLYTAAAKAMHQAGLEGVPMDYEEAIKKAAKIYRIPYTPSELPRLLAQRAEIDRKLAMLRQGKQVAKQRRQQKLAPTPAGSEEYWQTHALPTDRIKPPTRTLEETEAELAEDLRKWFKEKWVRFGPDGKIRGACARGSESEGKPKCLPQSKAHALGKKGRASAAAKKRREDPNPERRGPAKNVATKVKEGFEYGNQVQHPKYGTGQIIKVYPNGMITVNFPNYPDPIDKKPGVQGNFAPGNSDYQSLKSLPNVKEATGDPRFDTMMGRIVDPVAALSQDRVYEEQLEDYVFAFMNEFLGRMDKLGIEVWLDDPRAGEDLTNPKFLQAYEQASVKAVQRFMQGKKLDVNNQRLVAKVKADFDENADQVNPVAGFLGAFMQGFTVLRPGEIDVLNKAGMLKKPGDVNENDWDDADEFDEDDRLRDGDYVRDSQDGEYGEVFRMSGDPTERRVRILDRDGRGWYISPERLVPVDRSDPAIQKYFGKRRQRDLDETLSAFDADATRRIQHMLNKKFGANLDVDGIMGPLTRASIKKFLPTVKKSQAPDPTRTTSVQGGDSKLDEKQDACYHKVRSRYKVWPSAYASGALVQCRKKGAANWGTGGKKK